MGMIDDMYFGELHFDKLYKQGSEFGTLIHMLGQADDFIYEHLSPDDKRVYCRIRTVAAEVLATAELAQFKNGFRAGAQFALETFTRTTRRSTPRRKTRRSTERCWSGDIEAEGRLSFFSLV